MIKIVGTAKYAHKSNISELADKCFVKPIEKQIFYKFIEEVVYKGIPFDIIKYDKGAITLITSPDWDIANEPIVGDCYRWGINEWFHDKWVNPTTTSNYKQIYHNKWMFVSKDYKGFDKECKK